jgi:hypothetical protein
VLRIVIWLSVIFCLFFVWIAVFSFGLVFLPVPILLILAGFSPWTAEADAKPFSAEQPPRSREQPRSESPAPGEVVTYSRRFFGDLLLENVLFVITLGVGWIIWFVVVAPNGQTPAKKLLHVRIHDYGSGRIAPWWQVWLRELGGKQLLPAVLGIAAVWLTGSAVAGSVSQTYAFIAAIAVLTSADVSRRAIWDYLSGTTVRYESRRNSVDDL